MARTKHERTQQRKRQRREGEEGSVVSGEEARRAKRGGEERSGGKVAERTGPTDEELSAAEEERVAQGVTVAAASGEERAIRELSGEGEEGSAAQDKQEDGAQTTDEHGEGDAQQPHAPLPQGGAARQEAAVDCSPAERPLAAIVGLLKRLEEEISSRMVRESNALVNEDAVVVEKRMEDKPAIQAQSQEEKLRALEQAHLQRVERELEKAMRRVEMLEAENSEWKRAAGKQEDYRAEIHATHVLRRTQAAQLRRVAAALQTPGKDVVCNHVAALHTIANVLHVAPELCEDAEDVKDALSSASNSMAFPASLARNSWTRSSNHWPLKKEEREFDGEYAFRVFKLHEEPLKRHRVTLREGLGSVGEPTGATDTPISQEASTILTNYKHDMAKQFVYVPQQPKWQRCSRDLQPLELHDGYSSDIPLEQVFSAVDPTTPVHPGSEDAFYMIGG